MHPQTNAVLRIHRLQHRIVDGRGSRPLLQQIHLQLNPGDSLALMGDSGSGKSTLIGLIAGLIPVQDGEIWLAQQAIHGADDAALSAMRRDRVSVVYQQFNLLSALSVRENIFFSAELAGRLDTAYCLHLAEQLGLQDILQQSPATLSGGEQQRVAIVRAMAMRPRLLLADEPTGSLDASNSQRVMQALTQLCQQHGTALFLVTHSEHLASYTDRCLRLQKGQLEEM